MIIVKEHVDEEIMNIYHKYFNTQKKMRHLIEFAQEGDNGNFLERARVHASISKRMFRTEVCVDYAPRQV